MVVSNFVAVTLKDWAVSPVVLDRNLPKPVFPTVYIGIHSVELIVHCMNALCTLFTEQSNSNSPFF